MKKVILSQLILITSILISCTDKLENTEKKRDPNEVWMAIKPLLGNMIMIKKVASQF